MKIPFTTDQFLQVMKDYNLTVWPMQVVFYLLSFVIIYFAIKKSRQADRKVNIAMAFLWLWMGFVYHLGFFTSINKAAYGFGFLNIVQGILFLYAGVIKPWLTYSFRPNIYGITGLLFMAYALLVYPVIGYYSGHAYPWSPTFGLPCPTTIFTMGMFLWINRRVPIWIIIIPFLWSLVGTSAALKFGITEDIGLLISGVVASILIIYRNKKLYPDGNGEK